MVYGYELEDGKTDIILEPARNMVGYSSLTSANNNLPMDIDKIGYFDSSLEYNVAYDYDPDNFIFETGNGYSVHNPTDANVVWTVEF